MSENDNLQKPSTHADTFLRNQALEAGLSIGLVLLGRYEIRRVLGQGAMGQVLEVRDRQSGNDYALKRVPPELVRDQMQMRSIQANFALVSQLTHEHIATTRFLELDPANGNAYVILDLVRGLNLAEWIAQERERSGHAELAVEQVLGIAEQIAAALDYAHSQPLSRAADGGAKRYGILHRDLKPANVMLEPSREVRPGVPHVRLVDFGLAAEIQASLMTTGTIQERNKVAGTPVYMAPEQWEGKTLTRGVDQWALAAILYEMLSGRRPFDGPTESAVERRILEANPEQPESLSPAQWKVLKKTFNANRRERHRSCIAMVRELAAADRMTAKLVTLSERPMPEEFEGISGTGSGGRKFATKALFVKIAASAALACLLAWGGWRYREGAIRDEIAQAATKAEGARTATGAELASALKDAEEVRVRYAQRDSQELAGLDAALKVLKERKADLDGREARFNRLVEEAGKVEGTDPELALQKLMDAEDVGKPSTIRGYPDLLAEIRPSLDERKTAARTAWETKKKAAQETEEARKKALESQAGLEAAFKQLDKADADLKASVGEDALRKRLQALCDINAFGGPNRVEAEKAFNFGKALVSDRKYLDAAESFAKAEALIQAALAYRQDAEKALAEEAKLRSQTTEASKDWVDDEKAFIQPAARLMDAALQALDSGNASQKGAKGGEGAAKPGALEFLSQAQREWEEAAQLAILRRGVTKARDQVAGLVVQEDFKPTIIEGTQKAKAGDDAGTAGQWQAAKIDYAAAQKKFEETFVLAKQKIGTLYDLAKAQYASRQYESALKTLEVLIQIAPDHSEGKNLLDKAKKERAYRDAVQDARRLTEAAAKSTMEDQAREAWQKAATAYEGAFKIKEGEEEDRKAYEAALLKGAPAMPYLKQAQVELGKVTDPAMRIDLQEKIGEALVRAGNSADGKAQLEEAEKAILASSDAQLKAKLLQRLDSAWHRMGEDAKSIQALRARGEALLSLGKEKAYEIIESARSLGIRGDKDAGVALCLKLCDLFSPENHHQLGECAALLARLGKVQEGLGLTNRILKAGDRADAAVKVAKALVEAGDSANAKQILDRLADEVVAMPAVIGDADKNYDKIWALNKLAKARALFQDFDGSRTHFEEVLKVEEAYGNARIQKNNTIDRWRISESFMYSSVIDVAEDICETQCEVGDIQGARETYNTAKEFLDRLEGMPSNSADVIESGRKVYKKMAELLSVATKQPNGYPTDKEWFFLLATGNYPGARSAVLALSDEDYRDYAWPYLVEWSLLVGDSEQALADACQVSPKNSHYRLRSLLAVAEATRRSEILKANAGFGVRLEEKDKLDWYCGLIDRLVKLGDMDGARALALESVDLLRNAKYSHHHRSLGLAFAKAEDFENARRVSKGMTEKLNQSLGVEPWDRCQYQRYPIEIQGACVATMAKAWSREKVQTELEKLPPEDRVNALVELAYMAQPWTMEWAPMAYIKYMSGDGVPKDPQLAKKIFLDTLPKAEDGELTLMARNVAADPIGNDPELALLATARILEFLKKDFIQDYDRTRLLETAAACYARTGQFDHAIETQQQALDRLKEIEGVRRSAQLRMWVYKQKKPCNFLDW